MVSRFGDLLPHGFSWVVNSGGPWLAVAFALGARSRSTARGAVCGVLALATALVAYYVLVSVFEQRGVRVFAEEGRGLQSSYGPGWVPVAVAGGALFGAAGGAWRAGTARLRVGAAALLAGVLVGEGWFWFTQKGGPSGDFYFGVEFAAGLVLPWFLLEDRRQRRTAFVAALGIAVVTFAAERVIRTLVG